MCGLLPNSDFALELVSISRQKKEPTILISDLLAVFEKQIGAVFTCVVFTRFGTQPELLVSGQTPIPPQINAMEICTATHSHLDCFGTLRLVPVGICGILGYEVGQIDAETIFAVEWTALALATPLLTLNHQDQDFRQRIFDAALNSMPYMVAVKNLEGKYLYANDIVTKLYRPRLDTIVGKTVDEVYLDEQADIVKKLDQEVIEAGGYLVKQHMRVAGDRGFRNVDAIRKTILDDSGKVIAILSASIDKTEMVANLEKIEYLNQFRETIIMIASEFGITPFNDSDKAINSALAKVGKLIFADRAYIFDYNRSNGTTNNTHEWCGPDIIPMMDQLQGIPIEDLREAWVNHHFAGESVFVDDVDRLPHEHGLYSILSMQGIRSLATIPLMKKDECIGFVGFDAVKTTRNWDDDAMKLLNLLAKNIVSMHVRHANEQELTLSRQRSDAANAAKTTFLSEMSHEIRTPLNGIFNSVYMLANSQLTQEQEEYLGLAKSSLESLSGIVNNILDISKIEAGKVDIYNEMADLEHEIYLIGRMQAYSAFEKGINFQIDYDFNLPSRISFDRLRLRQVMMNFINNSVKYTENGTIEVIVKQQSIDDKYVRIRFSVSDTGIGIPSDKIQTISEKFVRIDSFAMRRTSGTGLGLSIANELITLFGGKLEVKSQLGVGSQFSFEAAFEYDAHSPKRAFPSTKGLRCLVIDPKELSGSRPNVLFNGIGVSVDFIELNDMVEAPNPPYDFLLIGGKSDKFSKPFVQDVLRRFGKRKTKIITVESVGNALSESLFLENGVDHVFHPPMTRIKLYEEIIQDKKTGSPIPKFIEKPQSVTSSDALSVLIVDDNLINRIGLKMIMVKFNCVVELAVDGYQAIEMVNQNHFDLILMDIQMPGINGIETAKLIRALPSDKAKIPIIAVTANAMQQTIAEAFESGMNDVLTKPIIPVELKVILDKHALQKIYAVPEEKPPYPDHLKVFNLIDFSHRFSANTTLMEEISEAYLEDFRKDVNAIKKAVASQDFLTINKTAHYFKGSVSYISAERTVWLCQQLMQSALEQDREKTEYFFKWLETEVMLVQEELRRGVFADEITYC